MAATTPVPLHVLADTSLAAIQFYTASAAAATRGPPPPLSWFNLIEEDAPKSNARLLLRGSVRTRTAGIAPSLPLASHLTLLAPYAATPPNVNCRSQGATCMHACTHRWPC